MTKNISAENIKMPTTVSSQIIISIFKCNKIIPYVFPDEDDWYSIQVVDEAGDDRHFPLQFVLHRRGARCTIYCRAGEEDLVFFQENTLDITAKKILENGRSTLQDMVINFLLARCPDIQQIFLEISPQLKVIDIETTDTSVMISDNVVRSGKKRKLVLHDRDVVTVTNGMVELTVFEDRYMIVKGYIQSGKTQFMISAAAFFALQGKHSVIVLRNSEDDKRQLSERVEQIDRDLQAHLGELMGQFDIVAVDSKKMKENCLQGTPKIFVCIGNANPLTKLNQVFDNSRKSFVTFIDEVDFVDSLNTEVKNQIDLLRVKSYSVFGVSATILDTAMEENIESGNLIMLSKPENYLGLETFQHHIIPSDGRFGTKRSDNMLELDPFMRTFLRKFATEDLTREENFSLVHNEMHPRNVLIRVTSTKDSNWRLLEYVAQTHPEIPTMFYSGGGCIDLHLSSQMRPITLSDGATSKIVTIKYDANKEEIQGRYHRFKNTSPSHVYQWLHENGGVEAYPKILTLAANMAARSISFGAANFEECKQNDRLWWHLTGMYLLAASSTDQPELMQIAGRLAVNYNSSIPLKLWCTEELSRDLRRAYWAQEELIERAREMQSRDHIQRSMKNILPLVKMCDDKISSRPITKKVHCNVVNGKKVPIRINTVSEEEDLDDGGWNIGLYHIAGDENSPGLDDIVEEMEEGSKCLLVDTKMTSYKRITEYIQNTYGLGKWFNLVDLSGNDYKKVWNNAQKCKNRVSSNTIGLLVLEDVVRGKKRLRCKFDA